MGIFQRISIIVSANVNELIDRFEDPETMLNQAVREMETAIRRSMDSAARCIAGEKLLAKQRAEYESEVARWKARAEDAVGFGNDEAARRALSRKQELQKLLAALDDEWAAARHSSQRLRRQIDAMRVRLRQAKRKRDLLVARRHAAEVRAGMLSDPSDSIPGDTAFNRFEHACERIERAEAESEAFAELSGELSLDFETEEEDWDIGLESELEALKQEVAAREKRTG